MKHLKEKVEHILRENEEARNSDKLLTILLWKKYCYKKIYNAKNGLDYISLNDYYELPSPDHISRCRRKIQETKYLPTRKEVRIKRKINEMEWEKWAINN